MKGIRNKLSVLILSLAVMAFSSCTLVNVDLGPRMAPLQERTIMGEGTGKVLMVDVSGVLLSGYQVPGGGLLSRSEDMTTRLAEELDKAAEDESVKALLLRVDSPGGTVAASDIIYHQIMEFKKKTGAKVVVSMQGIAASGGYYVSMSGDKILAMPGTLTGSVGVIMANLNLSGLLNKYGVSSQVVKSGIYKDIWSPFRPVTPEEKQVMQSIINDMFGRFEALVKKGRPNLTADQLARATTARLFTGNQALALGLVDGIGYLEDAFEEAKNFAGLDQARLVVYHRPGAYKPNVYAQAPNVGGVSDVSPLLSLLAGTPQVMYMWLPAMQ